MGSSIRADSRAWYLQVWGLPGGIIGRESNPGPFDPCPGGFKEDSTIPKFCPDRIGEERTMGHRIGTETRGRQTIHTLHDDESGASAAVLPSYGFNLFDLRLPLAGEARPVLVAATDFADSPQSAAGNGIPILFPYPN